MAKQIIKIESVLGGHSPTTHFAGEGQFRASLGIDPGQPIGDTVASNSVIASGLLRPSSATKFSSEVISAAPMWIEASPKEGELYVYDYSGNVYNVDGNLSTPTFVSALSPSTGNGMAYYDNYMYFAKNTDIARYGPLNGVAVWDTQFWDATISATALTDKTYPSDTNISVEFPNHILHRHSDNKLYIGDVSASNEGILNYIKTSRTSVEGDTNNGSTYGALKFPYGFYPTAIESYGTDLAIALWEGTTSAGVVESRAKIAFWDTTSTSYNKITYVEFPDPYISSMKNINGVLYVASGRVLASGFRITRFVGGYTMEEVGYHETGTMPFPDGLDGQGHQIVFGSFTDVPASAGCVFSLGLSKRSLGNGLFNIHRVASTEDTSVTSICLQDNNSLGFLAPIIGWSTGASGGSHNGLDKKLGYGTSNNVFWSETFRVGQPFEVKKIRIPLAQAMAASMTITAKLYTDDGDGTTYTYPTINNTNYPSARNIVLRTDSSNIIPRGEHNFFLELTWSGTALCVVGLPITIEIETLDD